ncbi:MAG: hypothetical protein ACHQ7M_21345, partial [Chloroflexota bacterium]
LTDDEGRRASVSLPDGTTCCCPELLARLSELLGPDAVQVAAALERAEPIAFEGEPVGGAFFGDDPFAEIVEDELVDVG